MRSIRRFALASLIIAIATPAAAQVAPDERIRRIENGLLTHHVVPGAPGLALRDRMREYNVPAVSVAVVEDGRIAWARAWGVVEAGSGIAADTATLFQAASISKPVAAATALRLVEQGVLSLDDDVNAWLRSWHVPLNRHTAREPVTLRRLLSHTAGTTVHGFPGYAAGALLPNAVQVLRGEGPANTQAVVVDTVPGAGYRYSGGGYTIAQQVMADATGRPFAALAHELVLEPAGMRHSTFEQPLPDSLHAAAAAAHTGAGDPIAGRHHAYPEQAAAGLWTTPSDLARFGIQIARAYRGEGGGILSPEAARVMLSAVASDYGLGFAVERVEGDDPGDLWFVHGGSNEGFEAFFAMRTDGTGAIVMTNGANGSPLAIEVLRAISAEYGLPVFKPVEREEVPLDADALAALAGEYQATHPSFGTLVLELGIEEGRLQAAVPAFGWYRRTLRAADADTLYFVTGPGEIAIERGANGAVTALVVHGVDAEPIRLERR